MHDRKKMLIVIFIGNVQLSSTLVLQFLFSIYLEKNTFPNYTDNKMILITFETNETGYCINVFF